MPVRQQADHRRHFMSMRRGMHFRVMHFFCLRHAFQHQHHGAAHGRHIDRLIRRIQNQHRLLHQRYTARRNRVVESTARGIFGTGRSRANRFGGVTPPVVDRSAVTHGIDRHWPLCAHRAFLGLPYHSLELGIGLLAARATVSPITDLAPASRSTRVHASRVAPVVNTSSTSKTRWLSTWLPGRVAKAPRTDAHLPSRLRIRLSSRARVRTSRTALYGSRNRFASGLAINAAWLYPRSCSRCRCSGTGTTTSAANAFLSFLTTSASRSENHSPAARCARISRGESHKPARPHTRQDFERGQKRTSCHGRLDKAVARPSLAPTLPEAARKLGTLFHARKQTKRGSRRRWAAGSPL